MDCDEQVERRLRAWQVAEDAANAGHRAAQHGQPYNPELLRQLRADADAMLESIMADMQEYRSSLRPLTNAQSGRSNQTPD